MTATWLLGAYFGAFALLTFFALHRLWLLRWASRPGPSAPNMLPDELPTVTIQLPLYNERFVAGRLLRAVFALDYPRHLLQVQVLDDSSDDTSARIAATIKQCAPPELAVEHIRRAARTGYKAGALAQGADRARGAFTLILDADFLPQPSLLRELLPAMNDPQVGMVQARWAHLNRHANRLTAAQALLLDAHFLLETNARYRAQLFFNFHGTAGLWRTAAIADAGGWQADTLTEDLDLSYRAQMRGWRFVFLDQVAVPAELPETLAAFKQQQARWAEGTMATARKHLRTLWRGNWPLRVKWEASMHLLGHSIYPATLLLALLALPALWLRRELAQPWWLLADLVFALGIIVPTRVFYRRAARLAGTRVPGLRDFPWLMLTGVALAITNTRAVCAGLRRRRAAFVRTPKFAAAAKRMRRDYDVRGERLWRVLEGGMAAYLFCSACAAAWLGMPVAVPMLSFLALAFGLSSARG